MAALDPLDAGLAEDGLDASTPVWAVFGDLMAGLLGAFVLMLVLVLGAQLDLASSLQDEVKKRQAAEQQRLSLEQALAGPLATGRVTLVNGRIGISGSVLFAQNSDELQPEGRQLLKSLAPPLTAYLSARGEMLMVSGFTDDRLLRARNREYVDNLELSAQRALTVTRTLIEFNMPSAYLFAAAFGPEQPVASNADAAGRARNRRVEMAPVPRAPTMAASAPGAAAASAAGSAAATATATATAPAAAAAPDAASAAHAPGAGPAR
ncbi:OmpA family protein (plasmid) [Aquabacterium sp. OR-4]|nr:OmpA family protein [Aquabacterium sp. OR-4]MDT7838018.1 OmpA family protein [Aquabacterium sp. OR-4]